MKIGIDIDEVISEFVRPYLEYHNKKFKTHFVFENISKHLFWENLGLKQEEILSFFRDFKTNHIKIKNLPFLPNAKRTIKIISKDNSIFIITSRHQEIIDETKQFLKKHFSKMNFTLIHSGDIYGKGKKSKADICKEKGIDILIEDSLDFSLQCANKEIKVLLFDKPWNQSNKLSKNIIRVKSWKEILEKINPHGI